jgi:hypothetical protein
VQQIKSCRRQLYRPKKLTLARMKGCFVFRSNRFRSMEHDTSARSSSCRSSATWPRTSIMRTWNLHACARRTRTFVSGCDRHSRRHKMSCP